jgi:hypothetical protein
MESYNRPVAGSYELADNPNGRPYRDTGYFGHVYAIVFPYSEAAMYCKLAGKPAVVAVEPNGVYLLSRDGRRGTHFTHGEAGVFTGPEYARDGADFVADRWIVELQLEPESDPWGEVSSWPLPEGFNPNDRRSDDEKFREWLANSGAETIFVSEAAIDELARS